MKESIDLTEHRDFREDRVAKSPVKKYPHKSLPWKKAGDFELAEKKSQVYDSRFIYSTTSNNLTWNVQWNDDERILDTTTDILNRYTDTLSSFITTEGAYNSRFIRSAEKWLSSSNFYYYDSDDSIHENLSTFPLGNKKYIISHRALDLPERARYESHHAKYSYQCRNCGNKIAKTPWRDTFRRYCDTCIDKEDRLDRMMLMERHKIYKKKNGKKCQIGRRDLVFTDTQFASVPCLSKRIPAEKRERVFPKRYNAINEPYYLDRGRLYDALFDERQPVKSSMRKRAVYYKGRELQRREEPWQPRGRVAQEYDDMFDDTDWRDMLRHRIGLLDGPILAERHRITLTNNIHVEFNGRNMIWV